jgi:hypothetical protein
MCNTPLFIVKVPDRYFPEREYILRLLFQEWLGQRIDLQIHAASHTEITVAGHPARLMVSDVLFQTPEPEWLQASSLPSRPLRRWQVLREVPEARVCEETLPLLYPATPADTPIITWDMDGASIDFDLFGSCFFMLTRYEECVVPVRDLHERFPARASIAYQEGFLLRPIVNEYLEVLWAVMRRLWQFLTRPERHYRVVPTHDVDWPAIGYKTPWSLVLRGAAGDLIKRRDARLAMARLRAKVRGDFASDPANTFDWLMTLSEQRNLRSEFYFIADHTAGIRDGVYSLEQPFIQALMRQVHQRGHVVGLHPSYESYRAPEQIAREFSRLRAVAESQDCVPSRWGGRQHYLRWENPTTWQAWDDAGLDYDSTVGFADQVGFRSGACYEYPAFNLHTRQQLRLTERPLIVMDCTLFDYMGLSVDEATELLSLVAQRCRMYEGEFVLLWHNSYLLTETQRQFYREALHILSEG